MSIKNNRDLMVEQMKRLRGQLNEDEYVQSMNVPELANHLGEIKKLWDEWKSGPLTKSSDIKPAQKQLKGWIDRWFKSNIKQETNEYTKKQKPNGRTD